MQYHQSADVQREKLNLGRGALIVFVILLILSVSASSPVMAQSPSAKADGTDALAAQASPDAETAGTTTVFLPLISKGAVAFNSDEEKPPLLLARQQNTDHIGLSPVAPPAANHETFVTDTGGWLDQYLGRTDLPNGLLAFSIGVNGPVLRPDHPIYTSKKISSLRGAFLPVTATHEGQTYGKAIEEL